MIQRRGLIMEGQVVLELANVLAGPSVGQFLGELGARVIKVESPVTKGDVTRTWKLKSEDTNEQVTAYFSSCNLGKESVTVDLRKPQGRDIIHQLARRADCVLASFKPGDAKKLHVDAQTLRGINPKLVYAEITGYGMQDPRPGYDAVIQAESGFQFMNGTPDSEPCKMPVALVDVITAHQLKEAILIELWRRERTGEGAHVNVSLMSSAVSALVNQAMGFLKEGVIPQRIGSDHPTIVPYGTVFRTKDPNEMLTLGVGSDTQFRQLCELLGKPEWADPKSKFAKNKDRCAHRDELKAMLMKEFASWHRADLVEALAKRNIPAGSINDMKSTFALPQAQELVVYGEQGKAMGLRQIAFRGTPEGLEEGGVRRTFLPPPQFGQHTDKVLEEMLGYSQEKISQLRGEGII